MCGLVLHLLLSQGREIIVNFWRGVEVKSTEGAFSE